MKVLMWNPSFLFFFNSFDGTIINEEFPIAMVDYWRVCEVYEQKF